MQKMTILEEELYESKSMQLELLDNIKMLEEQIEEMKQSEAPKPKKLAKRGRPRKK